MGLAERLTAALPWPREPSAEHVAAALDHMVPAGDGLPTPLLALAQRLQTLPACPGPDPAYADQLRARLVAFAPVATTEPPAPEPPRAPHRRAVHGTRTPRSARSARSNRRSARLAAGLAVLAVLLAGISVAGSRSLPGQPFYAIKRAGEQIQLAFAFGPRADGVRHLQFARTRLSEARALLASSRSLSPVAPGMPTAAGPSHEEIAGASSLVTGILQDMNDETRAGRRDLTVAYRSGHDPALMRRLAHFASSQQQSLQQVLSELAPSAHRAAGSGLALLSQIDEQTQTMLTTTTCTPACRQHRSGSARGHGEVRAPGCGCPASTPKARPKRHGTPTPNTHTPAATPHQQSPSGPAEPRTPQRPSPAPTPSTPPHPHPKPSGGILPGLPGLPGSPTSPIVPSLPLKLPTPPPSLDLHLHLPPLLPSIGLNLGGLTR